MKLRRRDPEPTEFGPVEVSTIPESCLPGGVNAEKWQDAFADYLEATTDDEQALAYSRMVECGLETTTGMVSVTDGS